MAPTMGSIFHSIWTAIKTWIAEDRQKSVTEANIGAFASDEATLSLQGLGPYT